MKYLIHHDGVEEALKPIVGIFPDERIDRADAERFFTSMYWMKLEISPGDLLHETFNHYRSFFSGAEPWLNCRFAHLKEIDSDFLRDLFLFYQAYKVGQFESSGEFFVRLCWTPMNDELFDLSFNKKDINEREFPHISFSRESNGYYVAFTFPDDSSLYKRLRKTTEGKKLILNVKSLAEDCCTKGWMLKFYGKKKTYYECIAKELDSDEALKCLQDLCSNFFRLFGKDWDVMMFSHGHAGPTVSFTERLSCKVVDVHTSPMPVNIWSLFEGRKFYLSSSFFRNMVFEFPLAYVQKDRGFIWFGLRFDHGKTCGVAYRSGVPEAKADSVIESYFPKDLIEKVV